MSVEKKARNTEMKRMRFEDCATLKVIGDRYGISHQRVRQLVGPTPKGMGISWTKELIAQTDISDMTRADIDDLPGVNQIWLKHFAKNRHGIKPGDSGIFKGTETEKLVSELLIENGIAHRLMPHMHPFDILLDNGIKIDVKGASTKQHPRSQKTPFYGIEIRKKNVEIMLTFS